MFSVFELLCRNKIETEHNLFADINRHYSIEDLRYQTAKVYNQFKSAVQDRKISDQLEVLLVSDNTFMFTAMLLACWLLKLKAVQPNSLFSEMLYSSSVNRIVVFSDKSLYEKFLLAASKNFTNNNQKISDNQSQPIAILLTELDTTKCDITKIQAIASDYIDQADELYSQLYLVQQTSGSTGNPKYISRSYESFLGEIRALLKDIELFKNIEVASSITPPNVDNQNKADKYCFVPTVPLFHAYGIVFRYFVPLSLGCTCYNSLQEYQEQLDNIPYITYKFVFISSPGFLKRLDKAKTKLNTSLVLSAGGCLAKDVLDKGSHFFNAPILEIYGSTETGVVGYRYPKTTNELWSHLSCNRIDVVKENTDESLNSTPNQTTNSYTNLTSSNNSSSNFDSNSHNNSTTNNKSYGCMTFTSPYINNGTTIYGEDVIEYESSTTTVATNITTNETSAIITNETTNMVNNMVGFIRQFKLLGRKGRILKIEDNRISIDEIEGIIRQESIIKDCAVVNYQRGHREYLGAAFVLTEDGLKVYNSMTKGQFVIYMRQLLRGKIIPLAMPRGIVFMDSLPETANGKVNYLRIKEFFA